MTRDIHIPNRHSTEKKLSFNFEFKFECLVSDKFQIMTINADLRSHLKLTVGEILRLEFRVRLLS